MRVFAMRAIAGFAAVAMASLVNVETRPAHEIASSLTAVAQEVTFTVNLTSRAEAMFLGRVFRRLRRAFRRVGRALRRGFRKIGRGLKKVGRAMGKGLKKVGRAMGKGLKKVGRAMGKGLKKVGRAMGKAAQSVGRGVWRGVRTMGKGFVKAGKGIAKVARGAGEALKGVGKAVGRFTKGTFRAAGKVLKGDIRGARRSFVSGAKSAGRAVVSGAKAGWKDIKKGAGQVLSGAKDIASGALDVVTLGQKDKILELIKKVMSSKLFQVVSKIATMLLDRLGGVLGSKRIVKALKIVRSVLTVGHQIVSAIHNPGLYLQSGRQLAIDRLTDLAMRVLVTPIRKLAGAAMGTLISLGKHFVTVPLSAAIGSALGSVTFGIGVSLAPLIKLGIDRFLEWAIDKISDKLAGLALKIGAIRSFLRNQLIKPVIDGLYDKLVALIRDKVPALAKKLTTSGEHAAGVRPEALVKGLAGVSQSLGKAAKVATQVARLAERARRRKLQRAGRSRGRQITRKPERVAQKARRRPRVAFDAQKRVVATPKRVQAVRPTPSPGVMRQVRAIGVPKSASLLLKRITIPCPQPPCPARTAKRLTWLSGLGGKRPGRSVRMTVPRRGPALRPAAGLARQVVRLAPATTTKASRPAGRADLSKVRRALTEAYRNVAGARIAGLIAARALLQQTATHPNRNQIMPSLMRFRRALQSAFRFVHAARSRIRTRLGGLAGERLVAALRALGPTGAWLPPLHRVGPPLPTAQAALARLRGEGGRLLRVAAVVLASAAPLQSSFEKSAEEAATALREAAAGAGKAGAEPKAAAPGL